MDSDKDEILCDDCFGLHTDDSLNVPDDQGRVLINVGHAKDEPDIYLPPQAAKLIKSHQIGGIRFLFDKIIQSVNQFPTLSGSGCILAHAMGLGKTFQVICFCDIFLRHTVSKTILCLLPVTLQENWIQEFNKFFPDNFSLYVINTKTKPEQRLKMILKWAENGGILLLGYELYRLLTCQKTKTNSKTCQDKIHSADLTICDEGHRIKNLNAALLHALSLIRSNRKIILTGYPVQNNLQEYWCMVNFVRPKFLGSKQEFSKLFQEPIENGHFIDATPADIQLMKFRSYVLHSLLLGVIQRRSNNLLKNVLSSKEEYVIFCRMTQLQKDLYEAFLNSIRTSQPILEFHVCCKIVNHPDILNNFITEPQADLDLYEDNDDKTSIDTSWAVPLMKNYVQGVIQNSPKMEIFFAICKETFLLGDRMLVFTQSLLTLNKIETFFKDENVTNIKWQKDWNYFRIDGHTTMLQRQNKINEFNANPNILLCLLSTKVGSLGFNLVGANRVIILDPSWNPCSDAQSISRVYRYGQRKPCFVYRFVMDSCLEKRIYYRQVTKQGMSDRVIDRSNPDPHSSLKQTTNDKNSENSDFHETKDLVIKKIIQDFSNIMSQKPFHHQSLLIDHKDKQLSNDEKHAAFMDYEKEKVSSGSLQTSKRGTKRARIDRIQHVIPEIAADEMAEVVVDPLAKQIF